MERKGIYICLLLVFFFFCHKKEKSIATSKGEIKGSTPLNALLETEIEDKETYPSPPFFESPKDWPLVLPTIAGIDFESLKFSCEASLENIEEEAIFVSPKGSNGNPGTKEKPLSSIQLAINRATPKKNKIVVYPGIYKENFEDYRGLIIDKDNITIIGIKDGEAQVKLVPSNSEQKYGIEITGNNVSVSGINLDGFWSSGIALGRNDGKTQRDICIQDLKIIFPEKGEEGDGIAAYPDHRATKIPVVDRLLVKNVEIRNPKILGVSCNYGPCINWRIENTSVYMEHQEAGDSGADAFAIESGENIVFIGVKAYGAPGDGIDTKGKKIAVFNSVVENVGRNGMKFWHGGDMVNCMIVGSGADAAVVFDGGGKYRILNSTIVEHNYPEPSSYMLTVAYDHPNEPVELTIANSIFYRHSGGIYLSPKTKARFLNNIFGKINNEVFLTIGTSDPQNPKMFPPGQATIKEIERLGMGSNNIFSDANPGFVNIKERDFRLSPLSSLIVDRGVVIEEFPPFDRIGRKRILGKAPDIGPDELK